jgi:poly-gamma-glutamate capsule biosynthesis protein CapA/YwtB (metallophosphatase superfamily)
MGSIAMMGDLMLGRGIDQIQRHSVDPVLFEPAVRDARDYVSLAEGRSGPVPRDVTPDYIWGDALGVLDDHAPGIIIGNLETSITRSGDFDPTKGIHYRCHPENVAILTSIASRSTLALTLANNHVLDLGEAGLRETLSTCEAAGIPAAGAGMTATAARRAIRLDPKDGSKPVALVAACLGDSGVPEGWNAREGSPGVFRLPGLGSVEIALIRESLSPYPREEHTTVLSIHWGSNWGYEVSEDKERFARRLVDEGIVDIVFGHSSHHPKPFEIRRGKPVFYGAGDFVNDYEGIRGHGSFRPELALLYLVEYNPAERGATEPGPGSYRVRLVPFERHKMRLRAAGDEARAWFAETLSRENRRVRGPRLVAGEEGILLPTA